MHRRKDVLTTGQVAQICNVAPRTVTKWFDSGQLKGYRIPGSRDRRIPTSELIRFMKAHNMPTDALDTGMLRVLVLDSDESRAQGLASALRQKRDYEVFVGLNSFDGGLLAQRRQPHVILINLMARDIDAGRICEHIRADEDLSTIRIVALAGHLGAAEARALQQKGYDAVVTGTGDIDALIRTIEQVTSILY